MTLRYHDDEWTLYHGDCREVLASLPDCSVDSIVTDPPYGLSKQPDAAEVVRHWLNGDDYEHHGGGFMGKTWDSFVPGPSVWRECLRVLKPGGHLLSFGGTRTYDLLVLAIRLAGFEIRDSIVYWHYSTGFPKSLDVSKAIDKQRHDREDIYKVTAWVRATRDAAGISNRHIDDAFGFAGMAGHWTSAKSQPAVPTLEQVPTLLEVLGVEADNVPEEIGRLLWDLNGKKGQPGENWAKREVVGNDKRKANSSWLGTQDGTTSTWGIGEWDITAPATDAAKQWEGWGTALKPAHEPVVLARKPLTGTVASNVLEWGTGALNIDGCRIATDDRFGGGAKGTSGFAEGYEHDGWTPGNTLGRWPANVIFDTEAGAVLDEQSEEASRFFTSIDWNPEIDVPFRYVPKPSKRERNCEGAVNCTHPTVKPLALMRYLVRLVTPPGGTVLDPFTGSGTTLMAAVHEGFHGIGIEMTDEYLPIIEGRVRWAQDNRPDPQPEQLGLL